MIIQVKLDKIKIPLKGDSLWDDTLKGKTVTIHEIDFEYQDDYGLYIWVKHNKDWEIYTDTGFEKGISNILSNIIGKKVKITFTEQGMQEDREASMEPDNKKSERIITNFFIKPVWDFRRKNK
jgi:hypothetical protein